MKKFITLAVLIVAFALSAFSADMTTVWSQYKTYDGFMVAEVSPEKAQKNGFEELSVALNSAPTTAQIDNAKRLAATIDENQKITSVNRNGVEVSVFAAPAVADGSLFKLLILVNKNDNADKALMVLYGTCTPQNLENAMQNLSLEDIIGA